ncbi:hypothetical protein JGH11_13060 [Dysgonomonas sp. Marseille-P4677]|uniref:hypothetical protein n=1 Tax=Dysgonomonas sp. Marseille-P4677 TaxID=2364790 RepID=UPI001911290C|nr:hypothetical protein [Dysgonomonas sp. Marseille-P4677]MBK5721803.1 hypothetical protein [Dysgonomonas sp. Marseille-P4677]
MPQIAKGGKFIFGWSVIKNNYMIQLPFLAVEEYNITSEKKVYIISGSEHTSGFCVSRKGILGCSKMKDILTDNPLLNDYKTKEGEFLKYKGRLYCWLPVSDDGILQFTEDIIKILSLKIGDKLLSIRGSDVAFVMGVKGRLVEYATKSNDAIEVY